MCTLTYIPLKGGFSLTHNRDERMDRASSNSFQKEVICGHEVYFPQDLEAKGTWFAHNTSATLCILNGGSSHYNPKPPYRHSRGLVLLHFFKYKSVEAFYKSYNFTDLEPFTLIIAQNKALYKLVHDHERTNLQPLNPLKAHIWSSTRLYTPKIRAKREGWFSNWLKAHPTANKEEILDFHLNGGEGNPEYDFRMSRWGLLKTVSITQLYQKTNLNQLYYHNFESGATDTLEV